MSSAVAFSLLAAPLPLANADSGYTSMTPWEQDNSWQNNRIFKQIAPASQTSYKKYGSGTAKISKLYKSDKLIIARAETALEITGMAVTFIAPVSPKAAVVANIVGTAQCKLMANCSKTHIKSYKKFLKDKNKVRYKEVRYFKWTNAKRLKYRWKVKSYYQHKTKKGVEALFGREDIRAERPGSSKLADNVIDKHSEGEHQTADGRESAAFAPSPPRLHSASSRTTRAGTPIARLLSGMS